jgi:hypothetical protein
MLQTATRIIHEDVTSPTADEEYGGIDLRAAVDNFWHYRPHKAEATKANKAKLIVALAAGFGPGEAEVAPDV